MGKKNDFWSILLFGQLLQLKLRLWGNILLVLPELPNLKLTWVWLHNLHTVTAVTELNYVADRCVSVTTAPTTTLGFIVIYNREKMIEA